MKMKFLLLVIVCLSLTSCSDLFEKDMYTLEECEALKKGDTVYYKPYGKYSHYEKAIIIKNVKDKQLLEMRDCVYGHSEMITSYHKLNN